MSSYTLMYIMNFTMRYDIVPFSHILVHSKFRIFGLAEARILSEPNLISTNERGDNIVMHLAYPECDEIPIPLPVSRIDDKSEKVDGRRTLI